MKKINEKALLVSLKISQWSARKYDKKATREVNETHKVSDAGRFNKILIAKEGPLQAIQKLATRTREFHYENTLPWSDNGERLLPSENYFTYLGKVGELKGEFEIEVRKFIAEYPALIEKAKELLNGLFDEKDYPLNIADRFQVKTTFFPVPESEDLRMGGLSENDLATLKADINSEITDRLSAAQADIFKRAIDQLKYMRERLTETETVFRDSLFSNVLSLVELLPKLNVTNDSKVDDMCADLKRLYVEPENVRNDDQLRKTKVREIDALLAKFDI